MSNKLPKTGVFAGGLALFSMFFGAGNLVWPLILGGEAGDKSLFAVAGLLITGVTLPLLGLMSMMLFRGEYHNFFAKAGRVTGFIILFLVQAILGPLGSIPRLITLAHATLKPYLPDQINFTLFTLLSCLIIFLFALKKHRVVDIIGLILTPILLACLGLIFILGFHNPPEPQTIAIEKQQVFFSGLNVGYNTLDLIASFIFASLVMSYFQQNKKEEETVEARRQVFKKMIKACSIAGILLAAMYMGLTYLASYYKPLLPDHAPEEGLGLIAIHLLGAKGALFACIAISLSCLTTAIPISIVCSDYIHKIFLKKQTNSHLGTLILLVLSAAVANLGFMGIAEMLSPILQILCPGLIILSVFNILHKLYEVRIRRAPIFVAFALAFIYLMAGNF